MLTEGQKSIIENILVSAGDREDLNALIKALSGDIKYSVSPTSATVPHTSVGWSRDITISLVTADGEVHTWLQNPITVSIADNSTAGTATVSTTSPNIIDGKVTVTVNGSATTWLASETATLTVAATNILGYPVAAKTCVITMS